MDEFQLINRFFNKPAPKTQGVDLSVGDDAALLTASADHQLVMTMDTLVSGRHFPEDFSPFDIGWRALAVNVSDLAAMGAMPRWCLLSLSTADVNVAWLSEFSAGFYAMAEQADISLVGGDTVKGPLSITVQATGEVPVGTALTRAQAALGDKICVGGVPGEAALGLAQWLAGDRDSAAISVFRRPQPQLALGNTLRGMATSCIDISDGLLADLQHILTRSASDRELGADLYTDRLPVSAVFDDVEQTQRLRYQLTGGDDYLLLFTLPSSQSVPEGCYCIGEISEQPGLRVHDQGGKLMSFSQLGYNHFHTNSD